MITTIIYIYKRLVQFNKYMFKTGTNLTWQLYLWKGRFDEVRKKILKNL